jgi:YgiT-type zinc finger domain-containing protein
MNCPLCRNGELQPGRADKALTLEAATLVIKGVSASICNNCGERYFDPEITQVLLDFAREAVAAGVLVDVRQYVA